MLARTGVWKISSVACGFSSIKIDYYDYQKNLISRTNEVENGKPAQLKNIFSSLHADVTIGNESWLYSTIKSGEVFPDDFNSYRRDRPDGKRGGVLILVTQEYDSYQREELIADSSSDFEVVWVKAKVKGTSDLCIGSFYRPPDKNNPEYLQQLHSLLNRIPTVNGTHLWLGGDFKLLDINWEDESVSHYASNSSVAHQLLNTARDFYLDQVVTEPARVTETSSSYWTSSLQAT